MEFQKLNVKVSEFSHEEFGIIKKYRALDERGKYNVRETVDREYAFVRPDSKGQEA